ncbi:hypothetical protein DYB32_001306 [Aphanomyces invadans]|uniref:COG4 transport protein middle alpha-helical bundle domain-containing protein n=1 Tax=Aphanomyces invadans TaxID=157072 RepID=A0A418B6Y0_9STRA|nr:hypothetical protein DYB32_001306 [Aphanomyces invadans]
MDVFHTHVGAFYEALAEEQLDHLADALLNLRHAATVLPLDDPATVILQEMLKDCENKANAKGQLALFKLEALVNTLTTLLGRKSNDDSVVQYERLDTQLRTVINAFYTSHALNRPPTDAMCLNLLVEYVGAEFKQRVSLRVDALKKLKAAAPVNSHGYIDRSVHLKAFDGLVRTMHPPHPWNSQIPQIHDASFVVSQVEEANVTDMTLMFPSIHGDVVSGLLEILALYAADARLMAWEKKVSMRTTASHDDVEADESLQMIDLLLEELACILQLSFHYSAYASSILDNGGRGSNDAVTAELSRKVHELNGVYLLLERFYIFQTIHKAVIIAEPQEIEPNVFAIRYRRAFNVFRDMDISTVEDASFVLDKAFTRATQWYSPFDAP